jgi:putative transcriptional regulator
MLDSIYRSDSQSTFMQSVDLTHHFLIAMPAMADPFFSRTLTYICEHSEQGALGVVVNRPIDLTLKDLFDQLGISSDDQGAEAVPVMFGGPIQLDRGFVLHQPVGNWQSTMVVNEEVGLTTSLDIMRAIADGESPEGLLIALGYSGWAPGQIEHELSQNAWLTVPATPSIIFELPAEERLAAAMRLLGVDFSSLSDEIGHS